MKNHALVRYQYNIMSNDMYNRNFKIFIKAVYIFQFQRLNILNKVNHSKPHSK